MMKPERQAYQDEIELAAILILIIGTFFMWALFTAIQVSEPAPVSVPVPTLEPTPAPTETPEPEPTLSREQIFEQTGGLYMGEWLSWKRTDINQSKDISTHVTVYGYRLFGVVDWYSTSWGQYFKEGAGDNQKFLFVFVNAYSDEGMARTWGIQRNQFRVQIGTQLYEPSDVLLPEIRLKQFDEIWNLAHVENLKPYGYLRTYNRNREGKETVEELGYIKAGKSNAWDGYIVFTVPATTQAKDIKVLAQFGNMAEPHWWQLE